MFPPVAYGTGTTWFKDPKDPKDIIDRKTVDGIKTALGVGYRHLDGAQMYNTEREIGVAIEESGVPRADIFLTTKAQEVKNVKDMLQQSLLKLKTSYVDLYLIHSPFPAKSRAELIAAWQEMEQCLQEGLARNIGVSNFSIDKLRIILESATIKPALNQVEMHPYLNQADLYAFLRSQGIAFAGFASLTPLKLNPSGRLLQTCKLLSHKYNVGPSAILLRWVLEQGASAVVTTSSSEDRLKAALSEVGSFRLTESEIREISQVGREKHVRSFFAEDFAAEAAI